MIVKSLMVDWSQYITVLKLKINRLTTRVADLQAKLARYETGTKIYGEVSHDPLKCYVASSVIAVLKNYAGQRICVMIIKEEQSATPEVV